jgi:hypothetical protein
MSGEISFVYCFALRSPGVVIDPLSDQPHIPQLLLGLDTARRRPSSVSHCNPPETRGVLQRQPESAPSRWGQRKSSFSSFTSATAKAHERARCPPARTSAARCRALGPATQRTSPRRPGSAGRERSAVRDDRGPPPRRRLLRAGTAGHLRHDRAEVIKRLGERAELPAEKRHPHVLRHTFATRYYHRHKDLAGLQRLLGHADIRTTMRYVHVTEDLHDNRIRVRRRAHDRSRHRLNHAAQRARSSIFRPRPDPFFDHVRGRSLWLRPRVGDTISGVGGLALRAWSSTTVKKNRWRDAECSS